MNVLIVLYMYSISIWLLKIENNFKWYVSLWKPDIFCDNENPVYLDRHVIWHRCKIEMKHCQLTSVLSASLHSYHAFWSNHNHLGEFKHVQFLRHFFEEPIAYHCHTAVCISFHLLSWLAHRKYDILYLNILPSMLIVLLRCDIHSFHVCSSHKMLGIKNDEIRQYIELCSDSSPLRLIIMNILYLAFTDSGKFEFHHQLKWSKNMKLDGLTLYFETGHLSSLTFCGLDVLCTYSETMVTAFNHTMRLQYIYSLVVCVLMWPWWMLLHSQYKYLGLSILTLVCWFLEYVNIG